MSPHTRAPFQLLWSWDTVKNMQPIVLCLTAAKMSVFDYLRSSAELFPLGLTSEVLFVLLSLEESV